MEIIFSLSHGQATMKHGFSINQQVINQNMESEAIFVCRFIKNHMTVHGLTL